MMKQQNSNYNNESITSLKGADRVRLRPGVIFGSDGLDGCAHAFFEILSNSIDEAREGYGKKIEIIRYKDQSIMVKDHGRGIPVDYNAKEDRFNWELVFCELYAGGKYQNNTGENYEFSLGLNGLGTCATQYASEYMDAVIYRDGGADRVRLRPGVIFGSDGLDGCAHAFFEILSNSIDEAREGYGKKIEIIRYKDQSIMVKDHGRGIPVDYNAKEDRFNWELVFCELYAGGKYQNNTGENYEFSLGLNGLGTCATQYASEYMDAVIYRDGMCYQLHFEKGENIGGLMKEAAEKHPTGTQITWRPDRDVFTDINIPLEYFQDVLKKQAVVNEGLLFVDLE